MRRWRFRLVQGALGVGFLAVVTRLFYLQVFCHAELARKAENQFERRTRALSRRGPVLDRQGQVLTKSVRVASCYADPTLIRRPEKVAQRLSGPLDTPASVLLKKIQTASGSFVWLKRNLSIEEAQAVENLNLFGVGLQWDYRRAYPNGNLAAAALGFVGGEGRGLSGVELAANEWLLETRPAYEWLRDGRGSGIGAPANAEGAPRAWVRLTLDRTIQYIAERELDWGMKRSRARAGMIVVQDPWTGEILAMASRPGLSLTREKRPATQELQIPAVHWVFEPGSTLKVVTAAAALEENVVKPQETFYCENGQWKFMDIRIHDHEPEKTLTFAQVMERSSNIGTAKVGLRLGATKMHDYLRAFGLGSRTGSEIPGEGAGLLPPLAKWSGVSLPVISFGQGVSVTAVQLAGIYSAIANGGVVLEPRIFLEAANAQGEQRRWVSPSEVRRVVSRATAEKVTKMLEGVVTRGTGQAARLDGWNIAGKTGTAQKVDPATKRYSPDKFIASFCGFVPAAKPRLTIVVILDEPQGLSWGGYNAGPVFRNVASHSLTYLGVRPDHPPQLAARARPPSR
jgi:cell division protein FtsI (penicillin-binding protein 3)